MIIFAHIGSYGVLFQIRNFDVPLMVLVSGMSFGLSYKTNEEYFNYLWKRVKRLIFPVWIFLTVYFVSLLMLDPQSLDLDLKTVITSYLLIGGIGYVWIIKVFILV
ncbi:MAG: fucose 4-O-acetylase-like acetyltransferase, partial [Paraglaciecola sp.]